MNGIKHQHNAHVAKSGAYANPKTRFKVYAAGVKRRLGQLPREVEDEAEKNKPEESAEAEFHGESIAEWGFTVAG